MCLNFLYSTSNQRIQSLETERLAMTEQLATKKEEFLSIQKELTQCKESICLLEDKLSAKEIESQNMKEFKMQLEVEKEVRSRCELREEQERRERIAAVAQLMAVQTECNNKILEIEEKSKSECQVLEEDRQMWKDKYEFQLEETRKQADLTLGLQNEVKQLHNALENASANHEAVDQLGKVSGELEILKKKLKEVTEKNVGQQFSLMFYYYLHLSINFKFSNLF